MKLHIIFAGTNSPTMPLAPSTTSVSSLDCSDSRVLQQIEFGESRCAEGRNYYSTSGEENICVLYYAGYVSILLLQPQLTHVHVYPRYAAQRCNLTLLLWLFLLKTAKVCFFPSHRHLGVNAPPFSRINLLCPWLTGCADLRACPTIHIPTIIICTVCSKNIVQQL